MRFLCAKYIATKDDGKNSVERLHISSSQFKKISILHSDMLCVIQNFEVKQKLFNEAFIYLLISWTSRLVLWRCTSLLCYFPHFPSGYIVSLSFYSTSSFIFQNANIVFINSRVESCNNHDKIFQYYNFKTSFQVLMCNIKLRVVTKSKFLLLMKRSLFLK